jgi:hypothetical protein
MQKSPTKSLVLAIAIALGAVLPAACDRPSTQTGPGDRGTVKAPEPAPPAATQTPTTPANAGTPTAAEKAEGSNPQQQQVDPKQPEQRRDFQSKPGG